MVLVIALAISLFATALRPAHAVGVRQVAVQDAGHAPITVTLYYPTEAKPQLLFLGTKIAELAPKAAITGGTHPLVLISHGTSGSPYSHVDTALALAESGFIVAAPTHNGDNLKDPSEIGEPQWIPDRARQMKRVDDFLVTQWSEKASIDAHRIGVFGFSAGGTTALLNLGTALIPKP